MAYTKSLEINPYMWCSFERICKLDPKAVNIEKTYNCNSSRIKDFFKSKTLNQNESLSNSNSNSIFNINLKSCLKKPLETQGND